MIGQKLYRTQTTNDSMGWARSLIHEAPDGAVFLADTYTHARGRQGRTWAIMPGQLMVTMLLKPALLKVLYADDISIRINQLSMAIALGILQPLKVHETRLKWPNDLVIANKKIGGILGQLVWEGEQPVGLIVGFAINVNNLFPADHELAGLATSLTAVTNTQHDMRELYRQILAGLNHWYSAWQQLDFTRIYKTWRDEQHLLGQIISVHQKDGSILQGKAQQVMPNGDLLLADQAGKQQIISFYQVEEVTLVQ